MIFTTNIKEKELERRIYQEAGHAAALDRYAEMTPDYQDAECARLQARAIRETLEALFAPEQKKLDSADKCSQNETPNRKEN